ncbi:MAG: glycosyltransferase [Deltaproteobacteria bacterium]|nr:glycosyltransferase [Deltaproteobacteria bacterium]
MMSHLPIRKKISVLVITYNHEKYLKEALEGILSQQVEADLEIIISDDNSSDSTLSIAQNYQQKYPGLITILTSSLQSGHTHNYERAWKQATGDYIAHCDGDDYWTSSKKLSQQLAFLEENLDFSACAHKMWAICDEDQFKHGPIPRTDQTVFTTEHLVEACFPHNCSLLFRNRLFTILPQYFHELTGHDWCIDFLNSLHGPIKIFPEVMGVWRMRSNGLWGGRQSTFHLQHGINFLNCIKDSVPPYAIKAHRRSLLTHWFRLTQEYLNLGEFKKAEQALTQALFIESFLSLPLRQFVSAIAQIKSPALYRALKMLRNQMLGAPRT